MPNKNQTPIIINPPNKNGGRVDSTILPLSKLTYLMNLLFLPKNETFTGGSLAGAG